MTYSSTAFQFTHLLQRVYDKLEQTKGLEATGGSTTTVIDTSISADVEDDTYNGYTAFVAYDAGGAGAAPEGEYKKVTDYVASTTTLTTGTFSAAVGAGDWITLARGSIFPLNDVIRLCNNTLKGIGNVPSVDTSLTTAVDQTEYDIPATVQWDEIIMVELEGDKDDANNEQYHPIYYKVDPPSSVGGTAVLVVPQFASGYTLRITSLGEHPTLTAYDSNISKAIHPTYAVAACALACAKWRRSAVEVELMKTLETEYELARVRHPISKIIKQVSGMPHWSERVENVVPDPINFGV